MNLAVCFLRIVDLNLNLQKKIKLNRNLGSIQLRKNEKYLYYIISMASP